MRVIGRIPIISGFNDSLEDTKEFVKLIKNLGIEEVNLLPFYNFGENKYRLLNRKYEYKNVKNLRENDPKFIAYENIFKNVGLIKEII